MDDWEKMTGAELAHILALDEHAQRLQEALDGARDQSADFTQVAAALLQSLGAKADFMLSDESTGKPVAATRLEVLADELRRACFEEG